MDLLKKHFEKVALAVALLALIGFGAYFAMGVGQLSGAIQEAPRHAKAKIVPIPALDVASYTNALTELRHPFHWTDIPANPFLGWHTNVATVVTNTPIKPVAVEPEFILQRVAYLPFKLLLRAYSWDPDKQHAYNFQINFIDQATSFFVAEVGQKIADRYRDTSYRITNFERVLTNVSDNVGQRELDLSRLTIQRAEEQPIVLVLKKITTQPEPVATVAVRGDPQPRTIRRGQTLECAGKTYNVVDITAKQMLIVDPQLKEKPISIPLEGQLLDRPTGVPVPGAGAR